MIYCQVGDYILTVNNETLKLITNAQARAILRRASLLGIDLRYGTKYTLFTWVIIENSLSKLYTIIILLFAVGKDYDCKQFLSWKIYDDRAEEHDE